MHLTLVHARHDTRILYKQCVSLRRELAGSVILVVADGKGLEEFGGVEIRDVGRQPLGRVGRACLGSVAMWKMVRQVQPDVVHLHDPELLPLGLLLRIAKKTVIFDMHENLPKEVLTKEWVPRAGRRAVKAAVRWFQTLACRHIETIFAETSYRKDFPAARGGAVVLNYPLLDTLLTIPRREREAFTVGYIGGVSTERGAAVLIVAVEALRKRGIASEVIFVGPVSEELGGLRLWKRAVAEGWAISTGRLKPEDGWRLMGECSVGVAVLQPSPNFVESYPTKLFEYMALSLPVLVSAFPLWREIVEDAQCGLTVDPTDPKAVAESLLQMFQDRRASRAMGKRGQEAAIERYSWNEAAKSLFRVYRGLLAG